MNEIQGPFPHSISQLVNLVSLDLSSNAPTSVFVGINILLSSLTKLDTLHLSYTSLSKSTNTNYSSNLTDLSLSSCNLTEFPEFLRVAPNLLHLELSGNKIRGEIPAWVAAMHVERFIDLS